MNIEPDHIDDDDDFRLVEEEADGDQPDVSARLAAHYLKQAAARPTELLADHPIPKPPARPLLSGIYSFPWYVSSLATWTYLTLGLTVAALLTVFCYHMLNIMFVLGRILALPVGLVLAAAVSYASAVFLCVVEQTSEGYDHIVDWPDAGWREWFWTLPKTLGALGMAAVVGYFSSRLAPGHEPVLVAWFVMLLVFPVVLLSIMDSGNVLIPFSKRVWRTFITKPAVWGWFYAQTLALGLAVYLLARLTFVDPPYITLLILSPILATLLLVYARLLGRLVLCFGAES